MVVIFINTQERIKQIMKVRGWSEYRLAKESGVPQSTLSNIFNRNYQPSIASLELICKSFGITLAQFFADGNFVELTDEQYQFFQRWAALKPEQKALIDELHSALDPKAYRKAVALLAESEFIDIFGVENSLTPAMDLFTKLGYLGLTCRLNTDAYLQQIGAGHLPHGAVAVAFSHSGSSADTVKALRLAKSHGAKTIAITNAIGAPLASWADVTLLTGRDSHTIYGNAIFSRVADTALVDMLYMGVILSDYGRFSTALDESGRMIRDRVFEN